MDVMANNSTENFYTSVFNNTGLMYELIRENKSLMMTIEDDKNIIAKLKLDLVMIDNGTLQLKVELEKSKEEISNFTVQLKDAEIHNGQLGLKLQQKEPIRAIGDRRKHWDPLKPVRTTEERRKTMI